MSPGRDRLTRRTSISGLESSGVPSRLSGARLTLAHRTLLPAPGRVERNGVSTRMPCESPAHRLRRDRAVNELCAKFVRAILVERQPGLDAGTVCARQNALGSASPVERVLTVVHIGSSGSRSCRHGCPPVIWHRCTTPLKDTQSIDAALMQVSIVSVVRSDCDEMHLQDAGD